MKRNFIIVGLAILLTGSTAQASIVNFGFETGDLTGWVEPLLNPPPVNGTSVVTSYDDFHGNVYGAPEGDYFLKLSGSNDWVYKNMFRSVLQFNIDLEKNTVVKGWAAYDHKGHEADEAFIGYNTFFDGATLSGYIWNADMNTVGAGGSSPWTLWTWVVPETSTYYMQYAVRSQYSTTALFDGESIDYPNHGSANSVVPEPATMLLLGSGMIGAFIKRRRKI